MRFVYHLTSKVNGKGKRFNAWLIAKYPLGLGDYYWGEKKKNTERKDAFLSLVIQQLGETAATLRFLLLPHPRCALLRPRVGGGAGLRAVACPLSFGRSPFPLDESSHWTQGPGPLGLLEHTTAPPKPFLWPPSTPGHVCENPWMSPPSRCG